MVAVSGSVSIWVIHVVEVSNARDECGAWVRGVGVVCEVCMCLC